MTSCPAIARKQDNERAQNLAAAIREQTGNHGCMLRELDRILKKPFEPLGLRRHTVLKENKTEPGVVVLHRSTQTPLISGTHGALAEAPATGSSLLGEPDKTCGCCLSWSGVAQITVLQFAARHNSKGIAGVLMDAVGPVESAQSNRCGSRELAPTRSKQCQFYGLFA